MNLYDLFLWFAEHTMSTHWLRIWLAVAAYTLFVFFVARFTGTGSRQEAEDGWFYRSGRAVRDRGETG